MPGFARFASVVVLSMGIATAHAEAPRPLRPEDAAAAEGHKKQARVHAKKKDELLATTQWRAAAELGDPEAQFTLARRLERGLGVLPFPDLLAAARQEAERLDAAALAQGYGPAVERVEQQAVRGEGTAQAGLARSLERQGHWDQAVEYYRAAYQQDALSPEELAHAADVIVEHHVAVLAPVVEEAEPAVEVAPPEGIVAVPGEVEALYRRALARGFQDAEVGLARVLFAGTAGVKRDPAAARRVLERGAADDHLAAVLDLGRRYEAGDGLPRDPARALQVYKRSVHKEAKLAEARLLVAGEVRRDPAQAVGALAPHARAGWFPAVDALLTLASDGERAAQLVVADMYLRGEGMELDAEEAAHWYGLAADRGDPQALFARYGLAADRGDPQALFALAQMHLRGEGVPKDPEAARRYFLRAHQAGSREATRALGY